MKRRSMNSRSLNHHPLDHLSRCPLCQASVSSQLVHDSISVGIADCQSCGLIFKDPKNYLNLAEQKQRYDLHNNNPDDLGYQNFLLKIIHPLEAYIKPGAKILDWGSGPKPALQKMLLRKGFTVEIFDLVYSPLLPAGLFDCVISTEVIEHFQNPAESLQEMIAKISPQGLLAVMTEIYRDDVNFKTWWYVKDPTHVVFYREKTVDWICQNFKMEKLFLEKSVFILRKIAD